MEGQPPPQCIATSATLGVADPARRREVLEFASALFNVPFEEALGEDPGDLIIAEKLHSPAEGGCEPDPSIYTHPALERGCQPGAIWTGEMSAALKQAGFPTGRVDAAAIAGRILVEEGLYEVFRHDARTLRLREAADEPHDLPSAALEVLGRQDEQAIGSAVGWFGISSLARVPGGDARLVPCRYHFFVRGLNRAYLAIDSRGRPARADPVSRTDQRDRRRPQNAGVEGLPKMWAALPLRSRGRWHVGDYTRPVSRPLRRSAASPLADLDTSRPPFRRRVRGRGRRGYAVPRLRFPH